MSSNFPSKKPSIAKPVSAQATKRSSNIPKLANPVTEAKAAVKDVKNFARNSVKSIPGEIVGNVNAAIRSVPREFSREVNKEISSARRELMRPINGTIEAGRQSAANAVRDTTKYAIGSIKSALGFGPKPQNPIESIKSSLPSIRTPFGSIGAKQIPKLGANFEGANSQKDGAVQEIPSVSARPVSPGKLSTPSLPNIKSTGLMAGKASGSGNDDNKHPMLNRKISGIDAFLSRTDPAMSYDWVAIVHPAKSGDLAQPYARIDPAMIVSITLPSFNMEVDQILRGGSLRHFPGNYSSISGTRLGLYAGYSGESWGRLSQWLNGPQETSTGLFRLPAEYKRNIEVVIHDSHKRVIVIYKLYGCWVTSWQNISLDYEGAARMISLMADISCDGMEISVPGKTEPQGRTQFA